MFPLGQSRIEQYQRKYYLLDPMFITIKLEIEPKTSKVQCALEIQSLEIKMLKQQFKTITRLVELDHEYTSRIQDHHRAVRKHNHSLLMAKYGNSQEKIDDLIVKIFTERQEVWALAQDAADKEESHVASTEEFKQLLLGHTSDHLLECLKPALQKAADQFQQRNQAQPKQKAQSYAQYLYSFVGSSQDANPKEQDQLSEFTEQFLSCRDGDSETDNEEWHDCYSSLDEINQ